MSAPRINLSASLLGALLASAGVLACGGWEAGDAIPNENVPDGEGGARSIEAVRHPLSGRVGHALGGGGQRPDHSAREGVDDLDVVGALNAARHQILIHAGELHHAEASGIRGRLVRIEGAPHPRDREVGAEVAGHPDAVHRPAAYAPARRPLCR